jgi:hypothetical protein
VSTRVPLLLALKNSGAAHQYDDDFG